MPQAVNWSMAAQLISILPEPPRPRTYGLKRKRPIHSRLTRFRLSARPFFTETEFIKSTINLLAADSWIQPIKILHVAGANSIILDPNGTELIDGAASYSYTAVGTIIEVTVNAAGTGLRKVGIRSATLDADGDTGVEVERTADADEVRIKTEGVDRVVINATATDVDALSIAGAAVTSSAAELNILDGVTSTAAELNILDGVTSTTAELNILDGVTSSAAELNILDGATLSTAEINILDGVTATAAEINKSSDGIGVTIPRRKIVNIGDWNMVSTEYIAVAHGLNISKIVGVSAIIIGDSVATLHPVVYVQSFDAQTRMYVSETNLIIYRLTGGYFDSPGFDSVGFNRGFFIVDYID